MDKQHDISVLNGLIKTTLDSVKGYQEACEDSETSHSGYFNEMAQERSTIATQLQAQVASMGGNPQDDSSMSGAAHRGFMNLKQAVMGNNDKEIVEEVERGEDHIKDKYQSALEDTNLSPEARQVVKQSYASIQKGHDRASAMKHQMQG